MNSAEFLFELNNWIVQHLPKTKIHARGWIGFNGVCCHHRGERPDKRGRGNLLFTSTGFSYNCFNCGFKTSWRLGRKFSKKNKTLLLWLGATSEEIKYFDFKSWQYSNDDLTNFSGEEYEKNYFVLNFESVSLPEGAKSFDYWEQNPCEGFYNVKNYIKSRGFPIDNKKLYWTPIPGEWSFQNRVILPIFFKQQIVGYIARNIYPGLKYIKEVGNNTNILYNADVLQNYKRKWVCVVEGPFDALAISGVGILKNSLSPEQVKWIQDSGQKPILVPDRDKGSRNLIEQALSLGWHISIPTSDYWEEEIKDVADAAKKYGRIATLKSILLSASNNELYIKNIAKKYCQ